MQAYVVQLEGKPNHVTYVFRGTNPRDPANVITDICYTAEALDTTFGPLCPRSADGTQCMVGKGFQQAFQSIKLQLLQTWHTLSGQDGGPEGCAPPSFTTLSLFLSDGRAVCCAGLPGDACHTSGARQVCVSHNGGLPGARLKTLGAWQLCVSHVGGMPDDASHTLGACRHHGESAAWLPRPSFLPSLPAAVRGCSKR